VIDKLKTLFGAYDVDNPPAMVIMMGNFSSSTGSYAENVNLLKNCFDKLADMIAGFILPFHITSK
jgi:hypothetical protein